MANLKTIYRGDSLTVLFRFNPEYDPTGLESFKAFANGVEHELVPDAGTYRMEMASEFTFAQSNIVIEVEVDDTQLGVRKKLIGNIRVVKTLDSFKNESIDQGAGVVVTINITNDVVTTDVQLINLMKGQSFTYSDFTPAQIAELQQPATDAIASIQETELAVEQAEELRVTAEGTRQTNTAIAITNANNAATNANTKAGLADTAANNANEKATLANNAALLANEKAGLADAAATNADNARLAIANELALKVDKTAVKQTTGTSETDVMSQKAVTNELALKAAHGYAEGETVKSLKDVETNILSSRFVPLGGVAFATDSTAAISPFNKMFVKNDFTIIKRFSSSITAYSSPFIRLENGNGDKILINNIGYVFTIQLFKSGIKTFEFTEATNSIFGISAKITLFIEVDFTTKEIRLSYSGYSRSISVPNLIDLRDIIFTKSGYGIYTYSSLGCRDWILIKGLYDFSAKNHIFAENNETSFVKNEHTSGSVDLVFQNPTKVILQGKIRNYVNGAVTFDRVSDNLSLTLGHTFDFGHTITLGKTFYESFSIDVNTGYISVSCGTVSTVYLFRLINKITGEITYARPYKDYSSNFLIPVGSYRFDVLYNCFSGGTIYRFFIKDLSADANFTVYDDVKIENSSIIRIAIPEMASFNSFYDPFQNSIIPSKVSLLRAY